MESDLSLEELERYRSTQTEPADFDEFWRRTLAEARALATPTRVEPIETSLTTLDAFDVTFSGFGGQPIRAWLRQPHGVKGVLPVVVQCIGYGGGRGLPTENLLWASSGFAHLYVDTRGQGSMWSVGDTPDPAGSGPQTPGFLTRGIESPETYYYRRLFTDAVRAVDVAKELPSVDPDRVFVVGTSQGGGVTLAVGGLVDGLAGIVPQVPFLCDFPRAVRIHDSEPYAELVRYLAMQRSRAAQAMETLRYFDAVNHVRRATAPAQFSVALMDLTCKPSTVYGAYHEYAGAKELDVYSFNGHEGGTGVADAAAVAWVRAHC